MARPRRRCLQDAVSDGGSPSLLACADDAEIRGRRGTHGMLCAHHRHPPTLDARHIARRADQLAPADRPPGQEFVFCRTQLARIHAAHDLARIADMDIEAQYDGQRADLELSLTTPELTWRWDAFALRPSHAADILSQHLFLPMVSLTSVAVGLADWSHVEQQLDKTSKTARVTPHNHVRALFTKPIVASGLARISQIWDHVPEHQLHPIVHDLDDLGPHPLDFATSDQDVRSSTRCLQNRSSSPVASPAPLSNASATEDEDDEGATQAQLSPQSRLSAHSQPPPVHPRLSVVSKSARSTSQPQPAAGLKRTVDDSDSDSDDERAEELRRRMFGATRGGIARKKCPPKKLLFMHIIWLVVALAHTAHAAGPKQCRVVKRHGGGTPAQDVLTYRPWSATTRSTSSSATPTPAPTTSATPRPTSFDYSRDKIRGVNLGGWLLLEPWITPSLFENTGNDNIVDEYTFNTLQDAKTVQNVLSKHWDTWIVEDDLKRIAQAGLNHVRRVQRSPPVMPNELSDLGERCEEREPDVGRCGLVSADVWNGRIRQRRHHDPTLKRGKSPTLLLEFGLIVGQPSGFYPDVLSVLQDYYRRAYTLVRTTSSHLQIALHDGFQPLDQWSTSTLPSSTNSIMDTHIYQIFNTQQVAMSWSDKLKATCTYGDQLANYIARPDGFRTYVGEWTTSFTDCAKWLNGRGVGARLDGSRDGSQFVMTCDGLTGSMDKFSDDHKTWMRRYFDAQVVAFERASGLKWLMSGVTPKG
ncbi:hypothetical protein CTheo_3105 [Ceratobasidium theobromae]|uniref:Uncharacterized protein n=1 Tax=Ceratobasidium theobromae TaxID=1582974 RepID=A0A5N5QPL4_9AGAM|nr:hypothetical protein CTheo_3105 [Ceratobasidium theobromae]